MTKEEKRIYREKNCDKINKQQREHRKNNPKKYKKYYNNRRKKHLEEDRAARRAYNKSHPEKHRGRQYKKKYGISLQEYNSLLISQGGVCKSCGSPPSRRNLDIDHDHSTGMIRGLLCSNCNTALGLLKEDPLRIKKLLEYLCKGKE